MVDEFLGEPMPRSLRMVETHPASSSTARLRPAATGSATRARPSTPGMSCVSALPQR